MTPRDAAIAFVRSLCDVGFVLMAGGALIWMVWKLRWNK